MSNVGDFLRAAATPDRRTNHTLRELINYLINQDRRLREKDLAIAGFEAEVGDE